MILAERAFSRVRHQHLARPAPARRLGIDPAVGGNQFTQDGRFVERDIILGSQSIYKAYRDAPLRFADSPGTQPQDTYKLKPAGAGIIGLIPTMPELQSSDILSSISSVPLWDPRRFSLVDKIKPLCCKCIQEKSERVSTCEEEAERIAQAYVDAWDKWASHPRSYGVEWYKEYVATHKANRTDYEVISDPQNIGEARAGWLCYHWRAFTYSAMRKLNLIEFKVAMSGTAIVNSSKDIFISHNWVTITVGKDPRMSGECTLILDPWNKPSGPHAYAPGEHLNEARRPYTPVLLGTETRVGGTEALLQFYLGDNMPIYKPDWHFGRWPQWLKEQGID
jgi:hypothetical protein